ncbi:MAG: hypothetical protein P8Y18_04615 [Candidatus Bathyarchaeota archaeon]
MVLKKEYIITEIKSAPDGSPFILITIKDPSEVRGPKKHTANPNMETFTSMNDLMKNFGNVITKQMMGNFATIIKITLDEYERSSFKVGDRISIKIDQTITGL